MWLVSPGTVLFRQWRVGRMGQPFAMLKLRTMWPRAEELLAAHLEHSPIDASDWLRYRRLRHDPRILPYVGRFLRASSIDELPQLWNVVRGDMSLVGPRPLELGVADAYDRSIRDLRQQVRPGITGLWQVSGRSDLDIETLLAMDARYVAEWSLRRDFDILWRTPYAVISRRGAY